MVPATKRELQRSKYLVGFGVSCCLSYEVRLFAGFTDVSHRYHLRESPAH